MEWKTYCFESRSNFDQQIKQIDISVPLRSRGRKSEHTERYSIASFLQNFINDSLFNFPFKVIHRDKPDFFIEYSNKIEVFASNTLAPAKTKKVEIIEKSGKKTAVITVIPKEKGKAIGKNGRNIHRSRMLMKRHFGVNNVIIQSPM